MSSFIAIGSLIAFAVVVNIGIWRRRKGIAGRAFYGREAMSGEDIYQRYYSNADLQKESVIEVWNEVAATLKVPANKLRPTDRFGKDIGWYLLTSDDLDTLFELAQARARRLHIAVDFASIVTVDEYVRRLAYPNATVTTS